MMATIGDNAGTYSNQISATTGTLANVLGYQYTFNAGDLTVDKAALNIDIDPVSADKNQGDINPVFTMSFGPFQLADTQADFRWPTHKKHHGPTQ